MGYKFRTDPMQYVQRDGPDIEDEIVDDLDIYFREAVIPKYEEAKEKRKEKKKGKELGSYIKEDDSREILEHIELKWKQKKESKKQELINKLKKRNLYLEEEDAHYKVDLRVEEIKSKGLKIILLINLILLITYINLYIICILYNNYGNYLEWFYSVIEVMVGKENVTDLRVIVDNNLKYFDKEWWSSDEYFQRKKEWIEYRDELWDQFSRDFIIICKWITDNLKP